MNALTMDAFAPIRALGWRPVAIPEQPRRLSDRTGDAITAHLAENKLWRHAAELEITRDGRSLTIRIFLPEERQSDRDLGRLEALRVRAAVAQAVTIDHHAIRFVDSFWQERGRKGWSVLVKAREL